MAVPEGFEGIYGIDVVLMLLKTIYLLKNAAKEFWRDLLRSVAVVRCRRSNAEPCMYFKWTAMGLLVCLAWIDDCACFGRDDKVEKSRN